MSATLDAPPAATASPPTPQEQAERTGEDAPRITVGVDVRAALHHRRGFGVHTRGLAGALAREPVPGVRVRLAADGPAWPGAPAEVGPMLESLPPARHNLLWTHRTFARWCRRTGVDLAHFPDTRLWMVGGRVPCTVTVHDIGWYVRPDLTLVPRRARWWFGRLFDRIRSAAAGVITVSETTRRDLVERMELDPRRVHVAYNGVDPAFRERPADDPPPQAGRGRPYVLFVGGLDRRKNLDGLLRAHRILCDRGEAPDLLVAGAAGRGPGNVHEDAAALADRAGDRVRFLGHVDGADLRRLYRHALAVTLPSHYEGFGLPVLEALASGTLPVAADIPAHREVLEGAPATWCDPADPGSIADALQRAVDEEALRLRAAAEGPRHAGAFTWERSAADHARAWRDVAGEVR